MQFWVLERMSRSWFGVWVPDVEFVKVCPKGTVLKKERNAHWRKCYKDSARLGTQSLAMVSSRTGVIPVNLTYLDKSYSLVGRIIDIIESQHFQNTVEQKWDDILCWYKLLLSELDSSQSNFLINQNALLSTHHPSRFFMLECMVLPSTQELTAFSGPSHNADTKSSEVKRVISQCLCGIINILQSVGSFVS